MSAETAVIFGAAKLDALSSLNILAFQAQSNTIARALLDLRARTKERFDDVRSALQDFRAAVTKIDAASNRLKQIEDKAKYEVSKGTGVDYVNGLDGKPIPIPVNTVLKRQYDITNIRYRRALEDAKRLAYIARLAIEQRIGTRLSSLKKRIGALDPPAEWADKICTVTGIDYKKLRDQGDISGGGFFRDASPSEKEVLDKLSEQFVGDYVAKLENFVDYYNIEFPSHDGDDTAILSLRDDLVGSQRSCVRKAPNLLLYSDRLDQAHSIEDGGQTKIEGWQLRTCQPGDSMCQRVEGAVNLAAPTVSPVGDEVVFVYTEAASTDLTSAPPEVPPSIVPSNTVYQRVHLAPGTYLVSWWDQARAAGGTFAAASFGPPPYRLGIYDRAWTSVATSTRVPWVPVNPMTDAVEAMWSARRTLRVDVPSEGDYYLAIGASVDSTKLGNLALAGLQLEFTSNTEGGPTPYVQTNSTRDFVSADCSGEPSRDLQSFFHRGCEANGHCFYDLTQPILLDTGTLGSGHSSLEGKISGGNYNFRHIDVALNFVGTGLRDCEADPKRSCFGSGYIEYTLAHDALQSGVLGRDGTMQCFNFGSSSINHGKALATERFITMPVGQSDLGLLSQPGITKPEFRGRPLDGSYRLRIWDTPGFAWNRLQDIQLVLKYRYWSAITGRSSP